MLSHSYFGCYNLVVLGKQIYFHLSNSVLKNKQQKFFLAGAIHGYFFTVLCSAKYMNN